MKTKVIGMSFVIGISLFLTGLASFAQAQLGAPTAPMSPTMLRIQNVGSPVNVKVIVGAPANAAPSAPTLLGTGQPLEVPYNAQSPSVTLQLSSPMGGGTTKTCSVVIPKGATSPTIKVSFSEKPGAPANTIASCSLQ